MNRPTPPMPAHGAAPPMPVDTTARHEAIVRSLYDAPAMPGTTSQGHSTAPPAQAPDPFSPQRDSRSGGRPVSPGGMDWVRAPSTSHISRFKLSVPPNDASVTQLNVVFKGPGGVGEVAEYMYTFDPPEEGMTVFEEMRGSPHPYGLCLYPDVILAGIPYNPV